MVLIYDLDVDPITLYNRQDLDKVLSDIESISDDFHDSYLADRLKQCLEITMNKLPPEQEDCPTIFDSW